MILPGEFSEFIESLNSESVRYVLVGGYAVAHHGHPRYTGDIDFFVEPSPENARRIVSAIQRYGLGGLGLCEQDFVQSDRIVQMGVPPRRIDLITGLSGVSFEEAWNSRQEVALGGVQTNVVSREVLVKNKAAAGRPKDQADLDEMSGGQGRE